MVRHAEAVKDIGLGSEGGFKRAISDRPDLRHVAGLKGYETTADLRAFFDGGRTLFDEVRDWLQQEPRGAVLARQDDLRAMFWIAMADVVDWTAFQLRWSEHLV